MTTLFRRAPRRPNGRSAWAKGLVLALFLTTLLARALDCKRRVRDVSAIKIPRDSHISFVCCEVAEFHSISAWCAASTHTARLSLFLKLARVRPRARKRRAAEPVEEIIWRSLTALALVCGDVEVNPGPPNLSPACQLCDKVGRKNSVKISCAGCSAVFHQQCLFKYNHASENEARKYRRDGGYKCWGCALPSLSDSFWSLPELFTAPARAPPPINPSRPQNKNCLKLLSFNARSLKNNKRAADLSAFLETHDPHILLINETWMSPEVGSYEFLPDDYIVIRKDRIGGKRPAGGVIVAALPHLQPKRCKALETNAEAVFAEIKVGSLRLLVGSVYRRPQSDAAQNNELLAALENVAREQHDFDGLLLAGDLNLDVDWTAEPPIARAYPANDFLEAFSDLGLAQFTKDPTRTTNTTEKILDLFLCDAPGLISSADVVPGISDHDALLTTLTLPAARPTPAPKTIFDYSRANWDELNRQLAREMQPIFNIDDVTECWEKWKEILFTSVEKCVPTKKVRKCKKKLVPWLDKSLKMLISIKNQLFAAWLKERSPATRQAFVAARKSVQTQLRSAKERWLWRLGYGAEGPKKLWRYIRSKSRVPENAETFKVDNKYVSDPRAIAEAFSASFQQNFSQSQPLPSQPFSLPPGVVRAEAPAEGRTFSRMTVSASELHKLTKQIRCTSSAGPDKINAQLLKNCATSLCPSLAHLFNLSLDKGELPAEWKNAAVTPIFKDGEKFMVQNFRPISLTSLVGKLLERCVRDKTEEFLKSNFQFSCQHGFSSGRSTTTLLSQAVDDWSAALDEKSGCHVHFVSLDWKKAFDRVPHKRLILKLEAYGIRGGLLKWFEDFLSGRTQFVKYNGAESAPTEVTSGVIQGSVLGPMLFNLFVADLPEVVKKSTLLQYADDCTVYKKIESQRDADDLQEDLSNFQDWCTQNGMELNPKKCKVMDLSRARTPLHSLYTIGGTPLQYVETLRLLGVIVSRDLRWNAHVDSVRARAAQKLGFASRNLRDCTPKVKRMAYLTLVRPIVLYALPAWHPGTKENTAKMERVQKRALHFIHGRHLPPPDKQNVMPIPMQLRYIDLLFFKKCLSGATDFDARARITQGRVLRGDDGAHPRLQPPPARTDFGRRAFAFRIVKPWNDLPAPLKDCPVSQFPSLCKDYLWQNFG